MSDCVRFLFQFMGVLPAVIVTGFVGCHKPGETETQGSTPKRVVQTRSADDLIALFDELGYTEDAWRSGIREIPRIMLASIPERWQKTSQQMPVDLKKGLFFRLAAPAVLIANERIRKEKAVLDRLGDRFGSLDDADRYKLVVLARRYRVLRKGRAALRRADLEELRRRVDTIPVSLALAQAAEESGWGTSRFAVLGNAVFGQWDFSGKGMVPREQREELGPYGLARFDSPQDSVDAYMLNLNTHRAYAALRRRRAALRARGEEPTGYALAETLHGYSERGEAYVKSLRNLMRGNHLAEADAAYLWKKGTIRVEPVE